MGTQADLARAVQGGVEGDVQIGRGQLCSCLLGPLHELQAGAGKDLLEAGVLPLARVGKAVKVKMPDRQARQFVGLHHGIGRALDAPAHAQGLQQVAHQRGFTGTQVAMQSNEGVAHNRLCGELGGKQMGGDFVGPTQAFYNRQVTMIRTHFDGNQWVSQIQAWGRELGFSQIGVSGVDLSAAEPGLLAWLEQGFHGDMDYMASHGTRRARPAELVSGTVSVLTARMDYLPLATPEGWQALEWQRLECPGEAVVSLYARGRDYHRVLRQRLEHLSGRMAAALGPFGHRVFTDSAPVLEAELAVRSGQGWRGKHTLVLNRTGGSMFFLGEIYVDIALPATEAVSAHCGSCSACITACPTQAIVAPYRLDARRCISYLTIEHAGPIPVELRALIGNRIYGCDDCQLACPWNRFAQRSALPDFAPRAAMTGSDLVALFAWSESEFLHATEGSPIRRIGHERWLRNLAVALGNALCAGHDVRQALAQRADDSSALVREHVAWALLQDGAG